MKLICSIVDLDVDAGRSPTVTRNALDRILKTDAEKVMTITHEHSPSSPVST